MNHPMTKKDNKAFLLCNQVFQRLWTRREKNIYIREGQSTMIAFVTEQVLQYENRLNKTPRGLK